MRQVEEHHWGGQDWKLAVEPEEEAEELHNLYSSSNIKR
jgi:hypothetical protein